MSAWICSRNSAAGWTAKQYNDPTKTAKGVNDLELEKAIRKTAGHNIYTPLKTSWSMIRPNSAVFHMSTIGSGPRHEKSVPSPPNINETHTQKVPEEVESDDDDFTGGLFD